MSGHRRAPALLVMAVGLSCLPAYAAAADRDGSWIFAIGLGVGESSIDVTSLKDGGGAFGTSRLAFPLGAQLMAGFEGASWGKEDLTVSTATVALYFFAVPRSLSVHLGAGLGTVEKGVQSLSEQRGSSVNTGVTCEFPLSRSVTIGPDVSYNWLKTKDVKATVGGVDVVMTWRSRGR